MKNVLIATLLLACTNIALAESPSYSYIGAAYGVSDWDNVSGTYHAWAIGGSLELTDNLFISGAYSQGEHDDREVEITGYGADVGYFSDIGTNSSWHTSIGYVRADSKYDNYDNTDANILVWRAGTRHNLTESLELNGGITSIYEDTDGTRSLFNIGALYTTDSGIGLELGLVFNPNVGTSIGTGVRYTF